MKTNSYIKGIQGEALALEYCNSIGMKHVCTRYKTPYGEIDLILYDGDVLVFLEVKYRKSGQIGEGLIAVTKQKQSRLKLAALQYMQENGIDSFTRMDVVEINKFGINYIKNAF